MELGSRYHTGMDGFTPEGAAARLQQALELYTIGVDVMRQNLRRRHPTLPDEDIERLLGHWLCERPGAEYGDCDGRLVDLDAARR